MILAFIGFLIVAILFVAFKTTTPAQAKVKLNHKAYNYNLIALISYAILLPITYFSQNTGLNFILFFVMPAFGFVAGLSFLKEMVKIGHGIQNPLARVFMFLVGIGGGIVIFIIAGYVTLIAAFNALKGLHF